MPKPYSVWIKQDNVDWRSVFETDDPMEARRYATGKIIFGNNVERVEVRDLSGALETHYDRKWFNMNGTWR